MAVNVSGSWDTYEYVYNGLNDVTGLIDLTSGSSTYAQMVVQYQYDAYGNTLSTTDTSGVTVLGQGLAAFNPFQYRGYYQLPGVNLYDLGARVYTRRGGGLSVAIPVDTALGILQTIMGTATRRITHCCMLILWDCLQ